MKTIIVGGGIVGTQLAQALIDEKQDLVIIEKDPEEARHLANRLDCLVITGLGNSPEILRSAGIDSAQYLIAVTGSDEINMVVCGLAYQENEKVLTVARVRNTDYHSFGVFSNPLLGTSCMVHPDLEVARTIIRSIEHGAMGDVRAFEDTDLRLTHIPIETGSIFVNRTIRDLRKTIPYKFLIVSLMRKSAYLIPRGDTLLLEGDVAYIIASDEVLEELYKSVGRNRVDLNKIAIVGGGKIGTYIVSDLLDKNKTGTSLFARIASLFKKRDKKSIVLIDKNYEKCKTLSSRFPDILVLNGDISDEGFVEEEGLNDYDLLIAATENQELNLVSAMYAKRIGVKKTISLVMKNNYVNIASHLGIDVTISLKDTVINTILRFVRQGEIKNLYSLAGGKIVLVEMAVQDDSGVIGRRIEDIKMPRDSLVILVSRDSKSFIPDGEYVFKENDNIIIITRKEFLQKVEELFV